MSSDPKSESSLRTSERRSFERVPLETEVSLGSDSQFFAGISGDISEGGLFVATYRPLPVGCQVTIDLELPDGKLSAHGVVRWLRDASTGAPGVGIQFEGLSPDDDRRIRSFCKHREPLYHDTEE